MELKSVTYWPVTSPLHVLNSNLIYYAQDQWLKTNLDKRCCILLAVYIAKSSVHILEKRYRLFFSTATIRAKLTEPRELLTQLELKADDPNIEINSQHIEKITDLIFDLSSLDVLGYTGYHALEAIDWALQARDVSADLSYAIVRTCEAALHASYPHLLKIRQKQNKLLSLFVPLENWSHAWHTNNTVSLAKVIYNNKNWKLCPILADALMDAGCDDPYVIWLLKGQWKRFGRGMWLIDHLIGKR